jgi:DNA-directed RNA polymerase II subunit RPB2
VCVCMHVCVCVCVWVNMCCLCCAAPRNIYQSSMGKQAIAVQPLDFEDKMETKTHILNYAQRPLVSSWSSQLIGLDEEPAGQCAVVAIMCHGGYNQEDSLLFNRASLQRGAFRTTASRVFKETEITHGSDVERFGQIGEDVLGKRKGNYDKLGPNGIVELNTQLEKDDVLIGKTIEYTAMKKRLGRG